MRAPKMSAKLAAEPRDLALLAGSELPEGGVDMGANTKSVRLRALPPLGHPPDAAPTGWRGAATFLAMWRPPARSIVSMRAAYAGPVGLCRFACS